MNRDKNLKDIKTCSKHTYTYKGINSALDAAQMKRSLEQKGNKVDVEIGFDETFYEAWVRLIWLE